MKNKILILIIIILIGVVSWALFIRPVEEPAVEEQQIVEPAEIPEIELEIVPEELEAIEFSRERLPCFEDFPVKEIFEDTPAPVDLLSHPRAMEFRTRLTEGAKKGPNFAGHYTIITWGAGIMAQGNAIVNAKTGAIHWGPGSALGSEFQIDSNLFIVNPPEVIKAIFANYLIPDWLYARYYILEDNQFRMIFEFKPLLPEPQGDIPFRTLESDEKLTEYLIKNTDLLEGTRFTFVRIEESIAFFTFHPYRMASRGLIQIKEDSSGSLVLLEGLADICNCLSVRDVHTKRFVHNQPEFIIFNFWPKTGTCVAYNVFHISKIYENRFKDLWWGDLFTCPGYGSIPGEWTSDIATIEFEDLDNDNNFEIIRTGYTIKCGDMCCCKEGPKKLGSEFQQIFTWDEQAKNFVKK